MCPWLPSKLYESLPLLYAAASLLCLLVLGLSTWTAMSAAALGAAAVMTWLWRRDYRRVAPPTVRRRAR
ncbi:MAG: hypothetical protein ACK4PH_19490 [Aquincola tertiaricarbonis]|uniref:hypothetical protein n=1 Tax=Aquincola tertiaricarbonis TaxID=391953 RepID=UPI0018DC8BE8|nr:hypothetical protein [Aquincola tertiaricarbonis]